MKDIPYEQTTSIDLSFRLSIGECWKYRHLPINRSICKRLVKAFRWHKQNCR